jgi:hydroxymethylglutaryl-CoA synthase
MVGITSYGAYIPFHRLSRAEIGRAWESAQPPGERSVANYDEDSLTMAVEAALDCLKGFSVTDIDGLFLASTTSPYKDKQTAATIATVLGLKKNTLTMDFGGSLRAGSNAFRAAVDMIKAGSLTNILVIASEMRLGYPSGPGEMTFGDGAAAVSIGSSKVIAEVENNTSVFEELQDFWRSDKDTFVRSAEDRFIADEGFGKVVPMAVSELCNITKLAPRDFSSCVLYVPSQRQVAGLVKKLGFDPKTQCNDSLFSKLGDAGAAMPLLLLVEALESAKAGNRILWACYGNGCDVFSIKTAAGIESARGHKRGVQGYLPSKRMLANYNKYLRWRELVTLQPPARPAIELRQPGPQAQWRENDNVFRLRGTKCRHCGTPQYPPQRVCISCGTKDDFEYYSFTDKNARIYTFSHDFVVQSVDPPVTVAMVDFEGGGRIMCDVTDRDPGQIQVGTPVEMTFRKLYYVGGIYNYWWKARPIRSGNV